MKNLLLILFISFLVSSISYCQVDIQPTSLGINICNSVSELGVNNVGNIETSLYVESDYSGQYSKAIHAIAYPNNNFGQTIHAILGEANVDDQGIFSIGVQGNSIRTIASNNGRAYGLSGIAGNATPGANFALLARLQGTNNGGAVVGIDEFGTPGWGTLLPSNVSYAGYFWGKGYFHDNVGIGQQDPKASLHVKGGNIYVENNANGVILQAPDNSCWIISVDNAGVLSTASATCP